MSETESETESEDVKNTSPAGMARAVEENMVAFYAHFGRMPGGQLSENPELTWLMTDIPAPHFNAVLRTSFAPELPAAERDARIAATIERFRSRGLPMMWWVMPSTQPRDLGEALLAQGLVHGGTRPGMAVELAALEQASTSKPADAAPTLAIETVNSPAQYDEWVRVFAASYGYPASVADSYARHTAPTLLDPGTPARHYLGRVDGAAVAIATLFVGGGAAGLYHVGTVPEARGQGFGTAIALAPLHEGRRLGYRVGVLFSSPMGLNIYRQLGFATFCQLGRYVLEPR
jgi:GNAT superfamily N-acetyltransferase